MWHYVLYILVAFPKLDALTYTGDTLSFHIEHAEPTINDLVQGYCAPFHPGFLKPKKLLMSESSIATSTS